MSTVSLPRQIARTRGFTLGAPSAPTVSADGHTVLFLRSRSGEDPVSCLWALDAGTGEERLVAGPGTLAGDGAGDLPLEERIRRERAREQSSGIVAYSTDAATRLAVFALAGGLWTVDLAGGAPRHLATAGTVVDPRPDPTGTRIAYVSGGAVRVIGADGSGDRAVAAPDGPEVTFGLAEHVAAESMGRYRGYWWAPDGTRLLLARVDNAPVECWYITDPSDPARPPRAVRYPRAGTANADVSLWIADLDGARIPVDWDRDGYEYVTAAGWDAHGPYASVQSRDQRTVRLLGIDPGDGATRLLREDTDALWVHLTPGVPARTASGALVSTVDRDDTRHLAVDGTVVTSPDLQVEAVLGVDGEAVLFTASTEPTETHLWRYRPGAGAERLSAEPGLHTGAHGGGTVVHAARTLDPRTTRTTVLRAGSPATVLGSASHQPAVEPRPVFLAAGPRGLRTAVFLPSWHRPGSGKLPVLVDPYAGPGMQKVVAAHTRAGYQSQWFAEQGFAVVVADGAGTPGRGPRWERETYGDRLSAVLDDQVEALHEAARLHEDLDLTRVGIRGWSFGGTLAALAVLRRPDVFHAAVAGAPATDQRLYDTHWEERYLGHPDEHPEHYDQSSLLSEAANLTRPLLLIHGLADDNVFPAHTLLLSAALLAVGRPHEVLPLSGATHMLTDETVFENLFLHQLEFLRRSLGLS